MKDSILHRRRVLAVVSHYIKCVHIILRLSLKESVCMCIIGHQSMNLQGLLSAIEDVVKQANVTKMFINKYVDELAVVKVLKA